MREQKIESRRVATDAAILDAILGRNPRDVLDLGCGEGWLARALSERGGSVTGVDASPALIEAAQKLGGGTFRVLPYEELSTLATQFDVIAANFALLDENLHLAALRALLRPGGALIVQTVHPAFAGEPYADGWRVETFASMEGEWPEPMLSHRLLLGERVHRGRVRGEGDARAGAPGDAAAAVAPFRAEGVRKPPLAWRVSQHCPRACFSRRRRGVG